MILRIGSCVCPDLDHRGDRNTWSFSCGRGRVCRETEHQNTRTKKGRVERVCLCVLLVQVNGRQSDLAHRGGERGDKGRR